MRQGLLQRLVFLRRRLAELLQRRFLWRIVTRLGVRQLLLLDSLLLGQTTHCGLRLLQSSAEFPKFPPDILIGRLHLPTLPRNSAAPWTPLHRRKQLAVAMRQPSRQHDTCGQHHDPNQPNHISSIHGCSLR